MLNGELLELQYQYTQRHKGEINIFPPFWFDVDDNKAKIEALKRALADDKMIIDVSTEFVESVDITR